MRAKLPRPSSCTAQRSKARPSMPPGSTRIAMDPYFGHGGDEAPAPVGNLGQLRDDLASEVPGEDEHKIRLRFEQRRDRSDRNAAARKEPALFGGAAVDDERDVVCGEAAGVEQGVAL